MSGEIEIVGARTNNLKSVNLELPLNRATMVVGVSGSGKSSLLADTLATEGNNRMRRFLGVEQLHLDREDVQAFVGAMPPCVHFAQGAFRSSRRTTIGTSSGLLSLLRSNFRRHALPWAEEVNEFVPPPSASNYGEWIGRHYKGRLAIWVVVTRWKRTDGVHAVAMLRRSGVAKFIVRSENDPASRRATGREMDVHTFRPLNEGVRHLIEAKVGGFDVSSGRKDISSSLRQAFDIGGDVVVEFESGAALPKELRDERGVLLDSSQHWVHPLVLQPFSPASDALLSFNSPANSRGGACPGCQGLGRRRTVSIGALIAHPDRSLHEGALSLWTSKNYRHVNIQHETIEGLRGFRGFDPDVAWRRLADAAQQVVLWGSGDEPICDVDLKTRRKVSSPRVFPGFVHAILRRSEGSGASARFLAELAAEEPCPECGGTRWSRAARAVRLGRWSLPMLLGLTFEEMAKISVPDGKLEHELHPDCRSLRAKLHEVGNAFVASGLGHLAGERGMTTLSEGESRRSRLATLLHDQGYGLALLLDEPARGLHEEDVVRLASALSDLKHRHTLIINEHRLSLARIADNVVEVGPEAGAGGGRIVRSGPPKEVLGSYSQAKALRQPLLPPSSTTWLEISGASIHTLSNVTCRIPLGRLVSITGVSGSGKSSFVRGILVPALAEALPGNVEAEDFMWAGGIWKGKIRGSSTIHSVLALEPRTPTAQRRSVVATLLGVADDLRRMFAGSDEATRLGLHATDFGWNSGMGRCQTCLGLGEIEDDSHWVTCPHCGGCRFAEDVLEVRVDGQTIADVLDMALTDLVDHPITTRAGWRPIIQQLVALDIGYLTLGRRSDRLSGGEHQRLRVARALGGQQPEGLLLILDEPSAGLHPRDVSRLLETLERVLDGGRNSVLLVEHNLDLIRASDWVVDFGPGGGPHGGKIIGEGPPATIAAKDTPTGRVLRGHYPKIKSSNGRRTSPRSSLVPKDSLAAAKNGRRWLKRLLGDEVEDLDSSDFDGLAIQFDAVAAIARPHEIGGLDSEIARLLLDKTNDEADQLLRVSRIWAGTPTARLRIHPLLEEIRVWGSDLPRSVVRSAEKRIQQMRLSCGPIVSRSAHLGNLRATGGRFVATSNSHDDRVRCVRDALTIGGGYVELWDGGEILASIQKRNLSFAIPVVGPLLPTSTSLMRTHAAGRCPACEGSGTIPFFDEKLIVARPSAVPTEEGLFHPEALKVLRGVRRSTLLPFLNRLSDEQLWDEAKTFAKLAARDRAIFMHGYWCRAGHGSFLKTPKSDPEDVQSWLRWNGIFRAVLQESRRSSSSEWRAAIEKTQDMTECTVCLGTGLRSHSHGVSIGDQSLFEWVRSGTIGGVVEALAGMKMLTIRAKRTRTRILHCLDPLVSKCPDAPLRAPLGDGPLLRAVYGRTVHSMMPLPVVE